jgi:hypothetical protein
MCIKGLARAKKNGLAWLIQGSVFGSETMILRSGFVKTAAPAGLQNLT